MSVHPSSFQDLKKFRAPCVNLCNKLADGYFETSGLTAALKWRSWENAAVRNPEATFKKMLDFTWTLPISYMMSTHD